MHEYDTRSWQCVRHMLLWARAGGLIRQGGKRQESMATNTRSWQCQCVCHMLLRGHKVAKRGGKAAGMRKVPGWDGEGARKVLEGARK